ncbi:L,D-transpeptidase family protein [Streptomyces sp. SID11385]|uniref:L,D-transpeptidase family protein n=1 Tax=Streptomyces sp. SID11385 TaxID=2706031 RepID=UPI0031BBC90D
MRLGLLLTAFAAVAGCSAAPADPPEATPARTTHAAVPAPAPPAPTASPSPALPATLPHLGKRMLDQIPADSRQAVVVTGDAKDSARGRLVLYRRTGAGWLAGPSWPAHNGDKGWTDDHHEGDLRSPIGVFSLSDAGGLRPDPGSRLPYHRSSHFVAGGTGFQGEPLAGSFDYVVAIDYNRVKGTSPLDGTRPQGYGKGGGVWIHVDHGGPTHACVSIAAEHMRELLRALDPKQHPVVVMGDAASLAG